VSAWPSDRETGYATPARDPQRRVLPWGAQRPSPKLSRGGRERTGLTAGRVRAEPVEDLASMLEDRRGFGRAGDPKKAATLAEERDRLLGNDPEPAIRGLGVGVGGDM
jgi:hypothetical protein